MGRKILLIGDGGHCRSVFDTVCKTGDYDEIGVIMRDVPDNSNVGMLPIVGCDADLPRLYEDGWKEAFITLGSIGNTDGRRRLFQFATKIGFLFPVIIDPSAVVADDVTFAEGIFVGKRAVINAGSRIGRDVIINTGAIIEHDCNIGDFAHISSGAVVCGGVSIGEDAHIGAGSVIRQSILIGTGALIGVGSVVVRNIPSHVTAYGSPCKVVGE